MNFKIFTLFFIVSIIVVAIAHHFLQLSLWWILLSILIYKAYIIYGSATIQSNFYINALCNSTTSEKQFAITFDDGPNRIYTPKVLSILKEYDCKATFFVIGKNIAVNESTIKQIDSEGHTIGNHTFSHSFFIDFKLKEGFIKELNDTSEAVYNIIGKRMKLFRPPYGVTTPHLAMASKELNYRVIGWNVRSLDTTNDHEKTITTRVLNKIKPGSIVLFHDTSEKTIAVLTQTLNFAKNNGFKIVGLEELLNIKCYE